MISLIDAGPGTGKTYSLIYSYLTLSKTLIGKPDATEEQQAIFDYVCSEFPRHSKVCFFAHSRSVKEHLIARLGRKGPKVMTFHGAGQSAIIRRYGFQKLVSNRTESHIEQLTGQSIHEMDWDEKKGWYGIKRIVHYLKTEARSPSEENLEYLRLKYPDLSSYTIPDDWQEHAADLMEKALIPDGKIEYADMPWMGKQVVRKPLFDLGMVDESQDVSMATYQLVTRLCKNVLFCGDKNQAINAFAGASEEMYDSIASAADAILPLKMTQRCPPAICELANKTRPGGISPGPNQQESDIRDLSLLSLPGILKGDINPANSLFVSRTNASVISCALFLHEKKIPVKIVDKDLADEIIRFIKGFRARDMVDLNRKLNHWHERMEKSPSNLWRQMCTDKYHVIKNFHTRCSNFTELFALIKDCFNETKVGFKLTTIHKAKGLEADNIFIINPPIPLPVAMAHPIGKEQEINLKFVAETRSSLNLYSVV